MRTHQARPSRAGVSSSSPLPSFENRLDRIVTQANEHQWEPLVLKPALSRLENLAHTLRQATKERWLYELDLLDRDSHWLKAQLRQLYYLHHGNMDIPPGREGLTDEQLAALYKTAAPWLGLDASTWYRALPNYPRLRAYLVNHAIEQHLFMLQSDQHDIDQVTSQAKQLLNRAEQLWQKMAKQLDHVATH
jgi:hypothetical protein